MQRGRFRCGRLPPVHAYAALLRGINLGNHNKIAMPALRRAVEGLSAGTTAVATYLQSGNVVFASEMSDLAALTAEMEEAIAATFGLQIPVLLRTREDLIVAYRANPFPEANEGALYCCYLAESPAPVRLADLAAHPLASARTGDDEFAVLGRHVYVHCPNGYGRTKLSNAFFERHLRVISTARNWRTTRALVEMAEALATP